MAIKSIERATGCWPRAAEDEPLFVLKSTDILAPMIVREWAACYREKHIKAGTGGKKLAAVILKYEEALELANSMESYRAKLEAAK